MPPTATAIHMTLTLQLGVLAACGTSAAASMVAAFYFGDWHVDAQMSALHGANWTEMRLATSATPRFPGHLQPNVPLEDHEHGFGANEFEDIPEVMERKIDSAVDHGVGMFVFDWYWYASPANGNVPDLQGEGGGTFLAGALEKGFLKAANRDKMEFALMWANQDWVDVHPAKKGWNGCYRGSKAAPVYGPDAKLPELSMFDGYMSASVYRNAFKYIAEHYFTQPNYYKAPTKLPNGTVADCCFFSFYQPEYVANGNGSEAIALMDEFRAAAQAVGQCLHLNHMTSADSLLSPRKVDSRSDYGWVKLGTSSAYTYPLTDYDTVIDHGISELHSRATFYKDRYGIPYVPTLSPGFDSSPRTLPSDGWPESMQELGQYGYPWSVSWTSNTSQWRSALAQTKAAMAALYPCGAGGAGNTVAGDYTGTATASGSGGWCPPVIINAWNEWSEGAYLEPDTRTGMKRLEAIRDIFGPAVRPAAGL